MIVGFDHEANAWVAAGNGPLRPIVVETLSRRASIKAYSEEYLRQQAEEHVYAETMTGRAHMSDPNYFVEDLG